LEDAAVGEAVEGAVEGAADCLRGFWAVPVVSVFKADCPLLLFFVLICTRASAITTQLLLNFATSPHLVGV